MAWRVVRVVSAMWTPRAVKKPWQDLCSWDEEMGWRLAAKEIWLFLLVCLLVFNSGVVKGGTTAWLRCCLEWSLSFESLWRPHEERRVSWVSGELFIWRDWRGWPKTASFQRCVASFFGMAFLRVSQSDRQSRCGSCLPGMRWRRVHNTHREKMDNCLSGNGSYGRKFQWRYEMIWILHYECLHGDSFC